MKSRVVTLSEIASCPLHRMDPDHYLPEHKTGECRIPKTGLGLNDLQREAENLVQLLKNRRPDLSSWNEALAVKMARLLAMLPVMKVKP